MRQEEKEQGFFFVVVLVVVVVVLLHATFLFLSSQESTGRNEVFLIQRYFENKPCTCFISASVTI